MMGTRGAHCVTTKSLESLAVFVPCSLMYAPEHRAQCGRNAAGDGKNTVLPPAGG